MPSIFLLYSWDSLLWVPMFPELPKLLNQGICLQRYRDSTPGLWAYSFKRKGSKHPTVRYLPKKHS